MALSYSYGTGAAYYDDTSSLTLLITPSPFITPTEFVIVLANDFTINSLKCTNYINFNGTCMTTAPYTLSVKGMTGTSQIGLTVTGFTSPINATSYYTSITSY